MGRFMLLQLGLASTNLIRSTTTVIFSSDALIFADFFLCWFFFSRRVERILPRGKNRRGKTAGPLCSPLFSSLYSSPGLGFRPCATKINRHVFFKKSAKISASLDKFETLSKCTRLCRLPLVQVSSNYWYIWIFYNFLSSIHFSLETYCERADVSKLYI